MKESGPRIEDVYFVPRHFEFADYFNELIGFAMLLQINDKNFSEIHKFIEKKPVLTVEEYLKKYEDENRNSLGKLLAEYEKYPQKMARLNKIIEEINSLKEDEEDKFKQLINEVASLLLIDKTPYFKLE